MDGVGSQSVFQGLQGPPVGAPKSLQKLLGIVDTAQLK